MLSVLTAHIIITVSCLCGGFLFYTLFPGKGEIRLIIFYLISGLILLTGLSQIIVLIFPIGWYVQMSLASILFLPMLFKWKEFKEFCKRILSEFSSWSTLAVFLFFISWLVVLLMNAGPVIMDDTESYHIQSIKWIQEYGSVPGLVNLHERFGFNSSWFSSVALFSFLQKTTGGFTVLNSVLSMWLCYWIISKYNQLQKENNFSAALTMLIIFAGCFIIWPLIRGNAATTNYDFITTCVVLILFIEIFFSSKEISPSIEWIIWPVYLFTVRIINFPLLLLSLFALFYFIKQRRIKTFVLPIVYSLLLIVPFLIRNTIIAGYSFYPATYFDLANVDWKPDPQLTARLLEYIKYYNRVSTTYLDIEQTKTLGSAWVPSWFTYLFMFDKLLILSGLAGIVLTITKLFVQKNNINSILLIAISTVWLVCWFVISPDTRFVYGILLFGIFLFVYHFISFIKNKQRIKNLTSILILLLIAGTSFYFISKMWKQNEYRNWILPVQLPQPPVKEITIDGIVFRIPEVINNNWNARCYGTELPCLYRIDPRLKARGKNIRSGFRLEK